ncbi:hypothetical protein LTR17_006767 [Elasticomyces elasticus]|nr:hypothetical protein LTR17_006767 [Elasticomyces elasticus]
MPYSVEPWELKARELGMLEVNRSKHRLHEHGEYSDLTIICGEKTFKVHKAIEGEESVVNLAALSLDQNADNTGVDDPEAVRLMIHYLYHGTYTVRPKLAIIRTVPGSSCAVHDDDRMLSTHAKVHLAAVKYGIKSLEELSKGFFLRETRRPECSKSDVAETIAIV